MTAALAVCGAGSGVEVGLDEISDGVDVILVVTGDRDGITRASTEVMMSSTDLASTGPPPSVARVTVEPSLAASWEMTAAGRA